MPKTDGAVLAKGKTAARSALHGMLPSRKRVDLSKTKSKNDASTSEVDVEDPITGDAMKRRQREDDTQTQPAP